MIAMFLRQSIRSDSEQSGRNICPKCGAKMEMGMMYRYHCPRCGYHQGNGYF